MFGVWEKEEEWMKESGLLTPRGGGRSRSQSLAINTPTSAPPASAPSPDPSREITPRNRKILEHSMALKTGQSWDLFHGEPLSSLIGEGERSARESDPRALMHLKAYGLRQLGGCRIVIKKYFTRELVYRWKAIVTMDIFLENKKMKRSLKMMKAFQTLVIMIFAKPNGGVNSFNRYYSLSHV